MKKIVPAILLALMLIGMLTLAFNIQTVEASGTIYIRADGSIEGTTDISTVDNVTYTFTDNIYDEIVIERDNIILDGAGYTVQGTGSGDGIDLWNRNNVTLKNVEVTNFQYGIYLWESNNNTFTGNTASNNKHGIYLGSSKNNILAGNTASSNSEYGIQLDDSSNNTLSDNTASNNGYGIHLFRSGNNVLTCNTASNNNDGIYLSYSSDNSVTNNTMSDNKHNFGLSGDFNNTIDETNTVDGKPVYYVKNTSNTVYDSSTNAGTFYVIDCTNVTIRDLTLTNNYFGALFFNTTNSKIENVTVSNNKQGISLCSSNNNTLVGNTATNNGYGTGLESSSDNVLSGNTAYSNNIGIRLSSGSNNNTVVRNTVSNNTSGVWLEGPLNNTISGNNITNSTYGVFLGFPSRDNLISGNNITNNAQGITSEYGYATLNNIISGNNIANNIQGLRLPSIISTIISQNNITNNGHGISLDHHFSNNNTVSGNNIVNNEYGIEVEYSSNNTIYHNNFINNTHQTYLYFSFYNVWDDGYPSGGNYWSDYEERYPDAEELDGSGIWNTPYVLNSDNQDHYPLMSSWPPPEHELVASITAPAYLQLGSSSSLKATITNRGLSDEAIVELVLLINGTIVDSTNIPLLQAGNSQTLSYLWTPTVEGTYNVTAYAPLVPDEASVENNQMTKFVIVTVSPPSEVQVGVKAGDWIKCDYTVTGWPAGTPYPEWLKVEILSVEGTTATVKVTMHTSDGTEQSDTLSVDVVAGGGTFDTLLGFVIPANCSTGDTIVMGGDAFTFNVTIDGETTRTYAGASRTVVYASFSQYGTQLTYYWDKKTGIMVEASTTSGGVTGTVKATETNMWEAAPSPFWMQWWLWVIVAVVIVASAGGVYFLKKRRPPTLTAPPLSTAEGETSK